MMKQHANHKIQKVRTLIVDDEPEAITMLKMLADDIETIEITGTACDPDKVLSAYLKATPDLLLLDIHLGTRTGFEVLQELHEQGLSAGWLDASTPCGGHAREFDPRTRTRPRRPAAGGHPPAVEVPCHPGQPPQ